jgi:hypothetical protein
MSVHETSSHRRRAWPGNETVELRCVDDLGLRLLRCGETTRLQASMLAGPMISRGSELQYSISKGRSDGEELYRVANILYVLGVVIVALAGFIGAIFAFVTLREGSKELSLLIALSTAIVCALLYFGVVIFSHVAMVQVHQLFCNHELLEIARRPVGVVRPPEPAAPVSTTGQPARSMPSGPAQSSTTAGQQAEAMQPAGQAHSASASGQANMVSGKSALETYGITAESGGFRYQGVRYSSLDDALRNARAKSAAGNQPEPPAMRTELQHHSMGWTRRS